MAETNTYTWSMMAETNTHTVDDGRNKYNVKVNMKCLFCGSAEAEEPKPRDTTARRKIWLRAECSAYVLWMLLGKTLAFRYMDHIRDQCYLHG